MGSQNENELELKYVRFERLGKLINCDIPVDLYMIRGDRREK